MKSTEPKSLTPDEQLESVFKAGHLGNFWDGHEEPYQTFGDLIFEGEAHRTFSNAVKALRRRNPTIYQIVSEADFAKAIAEKLRPLYDEQENHKFSGLWNSLSQSLLESPVIKFEVMREIRGIKLSQPDQVLTLGPFRIYSFDGQADLLAEKAISKDPLLFWGTPVPEYLIAVEVVARGGNRAYELADVYFEGFERLLKFLLGRSDERVEAGVLNYRGPRTTEAYAFYGGRASSFSGRTGPYKALPLDSVGFSQPGLIRLWNLIVNDGSELERRLMRAADWVGQSYGDRAGPSSFLKAAIALETLFTPQESALITPSIVSSLSESLAMLLADSPAERFVIERRVKKLYAKRSSIAHSGSKDVDPYEIHAVQAIARTAILKIFNSEKLIGLPSVAELLALIKHNKYAGPSLFNSCSEIKGS